MGKEVTGEPQGRGKSVGYATKGDSSWTLHVRVTGSSDFGVEMPTAGQCISKEARVRVGQGVVLAVNPYWDSTCVG